MVADYNTDGYISFNEALLCVKNFEIDETIRSHYIDLILVMFVDVGNNRSFLDHLCYSFVSCLIYGFMMLSKIYDTICSDPYSDTSERKTIGVENIHFPDLQEWILATLKENTVRPFQLLFCYIQIM